MEITLTGMVIFGIVLIAIGAIGTYWFGRAIIGLMILISAFGNGGLLPFRSGADRFIVISLFIGLFASIIAFVCGIILVV